MPSGRKGAFARAITRSDCDAVFIVANGAWTVAVSRVPSGSSSKHLLPLCAYRCCS